MHRRCGTRTYLLVPNVSSCQPASQRRRMRACGLRATAFTLSHRFFAISYLPLSLLAHSLARRHADAHNSFSLSLTQTHTHTHADTVYSSSSSSCRTLLSGNSSFLSLVFGFVFGFGFYDMVFCITRMSWHSLAFESDRNGFSTLVTNHAARITHHASRITHTSPSKKLKLDILTFHSPPRPAPPRPYFPTAALALGCAPFRSPSPPDLKC